MKTTEFPVELEMEYKRKRVTKDNSTIFDLKGWVELPSSLMERAVSGAVFGREIRNVTLDMLTLRRVLDI